MTSSLSRNDMPKKAPNHCAIDDQRVFSRSIICSRLPWSTDCRSLMTWSRVIKCDRASSQCLDLKDLRSVASGIEVINVTDEISGARELDHDSRPVGAWTIDL